MRSASDMVASRRQLESAERWEGRLRATRAIQTAASELKDLVRHALNAGVPVSCEIDGREINIADLVITINMRTTRAPPEND